MRTEQRAPPLCMVVGVRINGCGAERCFCDTRRRCTRCRPRSGSMWVYLALVPGPPPPAAPSVPTAVAKAQRSFDGDACWGRWKPGAKTQPRLAQSPLLLLACPTYSDKLHEWSRDQAALRGGRCSAQYWRVTRCWNPGACREITESFESTEDQNEEDDSIGCDRTAADGVGDEAGGSRRDTRCSGRAKQQTRR